MLFSTDTVRDEMSLPHAGTMTNRNIVITGFMGTGKTEVGREVARRLHRAFVDMDALIEEREGRTIPQIFMESGEPYFRQLEARLVEELASRRNLVIATGGGALIPEANRRRMVETGIVICLWAEEDALIRRLKDDNYRPLLARPDWQEHLRRLLAQRRPAYESLPYHVDTTNKSIPQVADEIIALVRSEEAHFHVAGKSPHEEATPSMRPEE